VTMPDAFGTDEKKPRLSGVVWLVFSCCGQTLPIRLPVLA